MANLTDYVIMPSADYQATCDAIREKTGKTDILKSGDLASEISSITGGSSADVRYVTFMNGDTVLYVKPVAVGDDCVNVLTKGLIETPTKDSTVQYNYTYSGWALTADGTADSSALTAVTEDRTVYAAYTSTVRKYTVNFYDGETLLTSMQVAYGSTPAYTAEKDGYNFEGWSPEIVAVTSDADYYAQWSTALTFAGASWADIEAICEAGEAASTFKVGQTRDVVINDATVTLIIVGFDHDNLTDGTGKASMTVMAMTPSVATFAPATSWATFANSLKNTLKSTLPSELQALIKPVTKKCANWLAYPDVKGEEIVDVSFEIFPPSMSELQIKAHTTRRYTDSDWQDDFPDLGETYEYFDNSDTTYYGPYGLGISFSTNAWIRQANRQAYNNYVFYSTYSKYTSGGKTHIIWAQNVQNTTTTPYPVWMMFCI